MKHVSLFVLVMFSAGIVAAQVSVRGYTKKDGTYVAPHHRTAPDNTLSNNYSTKGNVNPYTGKEGTVDQYAIPAQQASSYALPQPEPIKPRPLDNGSQLYDGYKLYDGSKLYPNNYPQSGK